MRRALLAAVVLLVTAAPAGASTTQESTFQDDKLIVYGNRETLIRTLDQLRSLGVDRIRVSLFWKLVAPYPTNNERPEFDAADPGAYPPFAWDRYDQIIYQASLRGIGVNLNVTSPAPHWATGTPPADRPDIDETFAPDPNEFQQFVRAAGIRYSGSYGPLPRVDYWSIWNEPNQGAWLTPQWLADPRDGAFHEAAPGIYRGLVDAAYKALVETGHGDDTILVGETAPKGLDVLGVTRAMKPRRFILRLYCLDDTAQFLTGETAVSQGCPTTDQGNQFVAAHQGLFRISGYAHHPYELTQPPSRRPVDPDFFTIANINDLSSLMRRVFGRYNQPFPHNERRMPLYLTEFGYQTNPPDPLGVTRTNQAAYLNESEWLAWRNPGVRTLTQFLLVDDRPGAGSTRIERYGATFQSGLETVHRKRKPAYYAYRLPIHIRNRAVRRGRRMAVWGFIRPGRNGVRQRVRIELRQDGRRRWRRLASVLTEPRRGYLEARVRPRRSGLVRLAWRSPGGRVLHSRAVHIRVT